jgi:hypothetical protein
MSPKWIIMSRESAIKCYSKEIMDFSPHCYEEHFIDVEVASFTEETGRIDVSKYRGRIKGVHNG